jgi:GST-like protein
MRVSTLLRFSPTLSALYGTPKIPLTLLRMTSTSAETPSVTEYVPPKVWVWDEDPTKAANKFGSMNRPSAGPRHKKELAVGKHPFQLYSLATPNGQKVTILLEELLEAGVKEAEYDAWIIKIMDHDQFGSDFVDINPNSKIPALMDYSKSKEEPIRLFESGNILLHLAEKFNKFLPSAKRTEVLNWLFWQMGSAPYLGGGFGHFFAYAEVKQQYPIDRFTMETKRQLDVLNRQLADNEYIAGDEYTLADIAIFPWYGKLVQGKVYGEASATFLNVEKDYPHVMRWAKMIDERPAVKRGLIVNKSWGDDGQLPERHDASDFEKVSKM